MEMVGAILFAVLLYVITTELSLFVARRRARAVLRLTSPAGSGGQTCTRLRFIRAMIGASSGADYLLHCFRA
jgi:hypothetical protein